MQQKVYPLKTSKSLNVGALAHRTSAVFVAGYLRISGLARNQFQCSDR